MLEMSCCTNRLILVTVLPNSKTRMKHEYLYVLLVCSILVEPSVSMVHIRLHYRYSRNSRRALIKLLINTLHNLQVKLL